MPKIRIEVTRDQAATLDTALRLYAEHWGTTETKELLNVVTQAVRTSALTPAQRTKAAQDEQRAQGLCIWGRCQNRATAGQYCAKHRKRYRELTR